MRTPVGALGLAAPSDGAMRADEFEALVERFQPALMRLAYGMAGDRTVAEDAVQACWQAAWRSHPQIKRARMRGWLFTVTANEVRRSLRRRRLREVLHGRLRPPTGQGEVDPRHVDLATALRGLDLRDRKLVALRYGVGLPSEEIGEQLGLSASGVRVRLQRVLARLRRELSDV
ncbi:MAG: sigma-70 family RNA polymerase sigma factor [Chloroflexota bacterium]